MTTDLDLRGRNAAIALREVVDVTINEAATTEALIAAMGGGVVVRARDGRVTHHRNRRFAMAIVGVAAVVVALVFIIRDQNPQTPVVPPISTVGATTTTVVVTTTTIDEATLGTLPTIGPEFGFSPYPPQVSRLQDGRVFRVLGSFGGPTPLEAFDPTAGQLVTVGQTLTPRNFPTYVELSGARLLIIGGDYTPADASGTSSPAQQATAEILDLATGVSESIGPIPGIDSNPATVASTLDDGTVLVIFGGQVAMVFDPATNVFTPTQPRPRRTDVYELFPLADGRVLVFSGNPSVYDPATRTFTELPGFMGGGRPTSMVQLADGRVLSVYGYCAEVHDLDAAGLSEGHQPVRTQVFDPVTGQFAPGPDLPHCATTSALLPSGDVFVAGYWWKNESEVTWSGVLDLATGETRRTAAPNREYGTAVTLSDGRVLLVAGKGEIWADIYDETGEG